MRICFWWRQPSGYFDACTRALVSAGHEVSVVYESPLPSAPFQQLASRGFDHLTSVRFWTGQPAADDLRAGTPKPPDVLVVASWGVLRYVIGAIRLPSTTLRLVAVDSPWRNSLKQWAGRVTHRNFLALAFDGAWIAGAPQWQLVRRLGFRSQQVIEHVYCCDSDLFSNGQHPRERLDAPFLFAGRLVPEKAVSQLGDAFALFRARTGSRRRLSVVGNGPITLRSEGIETQPFADPPKLRSIMDRSYALVNPAYIEHWGVSAHEGASLGLPLVLSRSVGASSRFLHAGISGFHAGPDVPELAQTFELLDQMDPTRYVAMSAASTRLGSMLTLTTWVENFEAGVERLQATKNSTRLRHAATRADHRLLHAAVHRLQLDETPPVRPSRSVPRSVSDL